MAPTERQQLSLADAQRMTAAALRKGEEVGVSICVAVCDPGGALLCLNRMEDAISVSAAGAAGKAAAAAGFRRPSGALDPMRPNLQALISMHGGHMIPGRGAVPVFNASGVLLGAIGVGGTSPEQDEVCAEAGAAAL